MPKSAARVAWYRFRATLRRRLAGYLGLGALVGLIGGLALASVTAARRTAVPIPVVPAGSVAVAALAALILANLVAALPRRNAARTRAALPLRAE